MEHSLRRPPTHREPAARLPRHCEQPHRRRRLPASHHLGVDDGLPRAPHRGDAGGARAPLAGRLRAHAARLLLAARGGDGASSLPAASGAPARGASNRAPQELGRQPRPRHDRGNHLPRIHDRVRGGDRAGSRARRRAGGALVEQVRRRAVRGGLLTLAVPGAAADPVGRGRPDMVRRTRVGRRRPRGAREGTRRPRGAVRPGSCEVALGPRAQRRVHASLRRSQRGLPEDLQPLRGGRRGERDRDAERLSRDRSFQGRVGTRVPDAGRPRRSRAIALAAHDGPVGAARLTPLRRHDRGLAHRQDESVYHEEHEVRAAGGSKRLRIDPD